MSGPAKNGNGNVVRGDWSGGTRGLVWSLHRTPPTMIPASLVVLLTGVAFGVLALACFACAWRRGHFDDMDAQAHLVFEPRDLRLERPWETAEQREARLIHGAPVPPAPGEWGGAE